MAFTWQQQCGGRAACVDGRVLPVAAEQAIGAEAAAATQKLCVAVVSIHEAARLARDRCDCAPTTARSSRLSVLTFSVLSWCWPRAASQMQRAFAIPDNNWKLRLYAQTHVVGCCSCVVCAQALLSVLCTRMSSIGIRSSLTRAFFYDFIMILFYFLNDFFMILRTVTRATHPHGPRTSGGIS